MRWILWKHTTFHLLLIHTWCTKTVPAVLELYFFKFPIIVISSIARRMPEFGLVVSRTPRHKDCLVLARFEDDARCVLGPAGRKPSWCNRGVASDALCARQPYVGPMKACREWQHSTKHSMKKRMRLGPISSSYTSCCKDNRSFEPPDKQANDWSRKRRDALLRVQLVALPCNPLSIVRFSTVRAQCWSIFLGRILSESSEAPQAHSEAALAEAGREKEICGIQVFGTQWAGCIVHFWQVQAGDIGWI